MVRFDIAIVTCNSRQSQLIFDDEIAQSPALSVHDGTDRIVFDLDRFIDVQDQWPAIGQLSMSGLHAQPGFIGSVQALVRCIEQCTNNVLIVVRDDAGKLNAPAFVSIAAAVLNTLTDERGVRRYNCALQLLDGEKTAVIDMWARAMDWANASDSVMPRVSTAYRSSLPGYTECATDYNAGGLSLTNFAGLWDWVDDGAPIDNAIDSAGSADAPSAPRTRSRSRSRRLTSAHMRTRHIRVSPYLSVVQPRVHQSTATLFEGAHELAAFQRVGTDIDIAVAWRDILIDNGVDDLGQCDLFALAQSSDAGRQCACHIMVQVFGHIVADRRMRNPSAFVHVSVCRAFRAIAPPGTQPTNAHRSSRGRRMGTSRRRGRGGPQ